LFIIEQCYEDSTLWNAYPIYIVDIWQLLTRQQNIASRHPRLSGIGRRNKLNSKKDSGQAGMTKLGYLLAEVIISFSNESAGASVRCQPAGT
jgi:hypothetical protein